MFPIPDHLTTTPPLDWTVHQSEKDLEPIFQKMVKANKVEIVRKIRKEKPADIITRECTIHMSKALFGVSFKNRAPRAIREIKAFATKAMNTR